MGIKNREKDKILEVVSGNAFWWMRELAVPCRVEPSRVEPSGAPSSRYTANNWVLLPNPGGRITYWAARN